MSKHSYITCSVNDLPCEATFYCFKVDCFVIHEMHVQSTCINNTSVQQYMLKCFAIFILVEQVFKFVFELISVEIDFVM